MARKANSTQQENTEETRRCIVQTAQRLFMESGYRAVSTRQVAQQCGISQPTLYYHFADKQAIFVEVTLDLLGGMKKELELIAHSSQVGQAKLQAAASYLLRMAGREMNVNSMMHDIEHELDEATRASISQAFFANMVQPLMAIIAENRPSEETNSPINRLPLVTLTFLFLSLITSLADQENELDPQKLAEFSQVTTLAGPLTEFYLYGLRGQPAGEN